ncbi:MAG: endonuclease/exonuclease/phosphatase family protein [Calditrichia bacterium]
MQDFKVLSYNIHSGIGRDRVYRLDRIIEILKREEADIIALQEVDNNLRRSNHDNQPQIIADALGMDYFYCVNRITENGEYGIVTLSRFPIEKAKKYDISYGSDIEPRGLSRSDIKVNGSIEFHVFNVHLGLRVRERKFQREKLLSDSILLDPDSEAPKIVLGDFNDRVFSVVHGKLAIHFNDVYKMTDGRHGSTFKWGPIRLKLDHIYMSDQLVPIDSYVSSVPLAKVASDHRPLIAVFEVNMN